jgi:hypothetical protein
MPVAYPDSNIGRSVIDPADASQFQQPGPSAWLTLRNSQFAYVLEPSAR